MVEYCRSCHQPFADFKELAKHIRKSKTGHRQGKIWAAKYLLRVNQLDKKPEYGERTPLTEEQKANKESTIREISGETKNALCVCPRCKQGHREMLPIEYTDSVNAWRTDKGNLYRLCAVCTIKGG